MTETVGNAVTNPGIHIHATQCNTKDDSRAEVIFISDDQQINPSDVNFEWKNFDTVTIRYNKKLRIFKMEGETRNIKPEIVFEYILTDRQK